MPLGSDLHSHDETLFGSRVKVHAMHSGHYLLDVKWIARDDWALRAIASILIARHSEDAPVFVASRPGAWALNNDWPGSAARKERVRHMTILSAGPARQFEA
jgi:hypothetical protein